MKRYKRIGILLGVLLVISGAAYGVSRYEERKEAIKNSDEVILEVSSEEVKALSWECETGSYAFHKEEGWIYDEDEAFPVDEEKIGELLEIFEEFGVSFVIEDVEDFAQYGLEEPVCKIYLETEEAALEVLLGNYSAMDSQRYVSIGDGKVYLVQNDPLDLFAIEISDIIAHDEIPSLEGVTRIRFDGAESGQIAYEENSSGSYYDGDVYFMEGEEESLPLDTDKVDSYLNAVEQLGLTDYVTYNASEEELASCGLDEPELSLTVAYTAENDEGEKSEETFVLHIGRDPEEQASPEEDAGEEAEEAVTAYARVGDSPIIYRISSDSYEKLTATSYDALRHSEIFWAAAGDITGLDITLEDTDYTITSESGEEGRTFYYQEEELETAGLFSAVRGITADSFTEETPSGKEEISLTVYLDNENYPQVSLAFYRYDGELCIAEVDGEPVAFVKRADVVALTEAVYGIVLK